MSIKPLVRLTPIVVDCTVSEQTQQFTMTVSEQSLAFNAGLETQIVAGLVAEFDGDYSYTPSSETITIPCADLKMVDNITINPVPQTYGLITWNGSFLTVS